MSDHRDPDSYPAERVKAFADAVVAIAMTLLILPLMESVADVAGEELSAQHWFGEHGQQLQSFLVSFAIIAMFWINHHRLFAQVERVRVALIWLLMAWLLSIVWLPVATAMSGQMDDHDWLVKVIYIGSMIVTCLVTLATRGYLIRHPALHAYDPSLLRHGMAVDIAMSVLFGAALVVAVLLPAVGYWALFLMFLSGPLQNLFARMLDRGAAA